MSSRGTTLRSRENPFGESPDLDGLTLLAGVEMYGRWHHVLTHGLVFSVITCAVCALLARARWRVALLAFAAFHLHIVCDLLGSGIEWTITYLYPFSVWQLATPYGWRIWRAGDLRPGSILFATFAACGVGRG